MKQAGGSGARRSFQAETQHFEEQGIEVSRLAAKAESREPENQERDWSYKAPFILKVAGSQANQEETTPCPDGLCQEQPGPGRCFSNLGDLCV